MNPVSLLLFALLFEESSERLLYCKYFSACFISSNSCFNFRCFIFSYSSLSCTNKTSKSIPNRFFIALCKTFAVFWFRFSVAFIPQEFIFNVPSSIVNLSALIALIQGDRSCGLFLRFLRIVEIISFLVCTISLYLNEIFTSSRLGTTFIKFSFILSKEK